MASKIKWRRATAPVFPDFKVKPSESEVFLKFEIKQVSEVVSRHSVRPLDMAYKLTMLFENLSQGPLNVRCPYSILKLVQAR